MLWKRNFITGTNSISMYYVNRAGLLITAQRKSPRATVLPSSGGKNAGTVALKLSLYANLKFKEDYCREPISTEAKTLFLGTVHAFDPRTFS